MASETKDAAGGTETGRLLPASEPRSRPRARFPDNEVSEVHRGPDPDRGSQSPDRHSNRLQKQFATLNERSPLLTTKVGDGIPFNLETAITPGDDEEPEETKSTWYIFLMTICIGGLQLAWAVELSNGSPYLLSLGISKSLLAFVWIAGPLSGTLVQPYVGIRSDNCRISWGKRKPFMVAGAVATIISLMALAWTREIVHGVAGALGRSADEKGVQQATVIFAVAFIYILDFAINTVQAAIRAFMVDNAPVHQQEQANAWAGRIAGFGNIVGYLAAYVDLPTIFPFFGNTQFKVLCAIACICLGASVATSTSYVKERDPRLEGPPEETSGVFSFFGQIWASMNRLPPQIRAVCEVQFFNWIGWFPFLFYITTYIGQLYVNPIFERAPHLSDDDINKAWEEGTRRGASALLVFAITSFTANVALPFFVVPTYRAPPPKPAPRPKTPLTPRTRRPGLHRRGTSINFQTPRTPGTPGQFFFPPVPAPETKPRLTRFLNAIQIKWLTLRRAWLVSHVLFAICMGMTFFVRTDAQGIVLVGVIGLSWALSNWAPFALLSAEISKRDAARRARRARRPSAATTDSEEAEEELEAQDQAGVILGLHNVAIAAPQVIATLVSSVIFSYTQKGRGVAGDDSVGWVLRFGGLAALVAAYMTSRVREEAKTGKEVDDGGESV